MCKAKELTNQFLNLVNEIDNTYSFFTTEQSKYDKMTSDVLHKIELTNFNASDGYKLCKQLQGIQVERRKVKDEMESLVKLFSASKTIKENLLSVQKKIINIEEQQEIRGYKPRVLKEMRVKRTDQNRIQVNS